MAEEYKHVEEDGDLSEDEFEVRPAVAGSALKLTKSHLEIPRDARGEADKDSEEAAARGGEIAIVFKHGGASVHARFPVGQDIGNVKAYFADAVNLQAANIVLTFAGTVLIDPLSLKDYEEIVKKSHDGEVELEVTTA